MPTLPPDVAVGVRHADPDALAIVFRTFAGPLGAWVASQVNDRTAAEEIVEETFLDLVAGCRRITGDATSIRAWLYRAARHNVIDHLRRRDADRSIPVEEVPEVPDGDDLAVKAVQDDDADRLRSALGHLAPAQQEVVTLRYLAELTTREVAEVTGRSEVAVRGLLLRGLQALRRALPPEDSTADGTVPSEEMGST